MIPSLTEKCVPPLMALPICCWKLDCCPQDPLVVPEITAMTALPDIPPAEPGGYSKTFELWMEEQKKMGANSRSYLDGYLNHPVLKPDFPKDFTELLRKSVTGSRELAHAGTTLEAPQDGSFLKKFFGGADVHGPREGHRGGYGGPLESKGDR